LPGWQRVRHLTAIRRLLSLVDAASVGTALVGDALVGTALLPVGAGARSGLLLGLLVRGVRLLCGILLVGV
jgi:hypothetical protein